MSLTFIAVFAGLTLLLAVFSGLTLLLVLTLLSLMNRQCRSGTTQKRKGPAGPGYHLVDIPRGDLGELSKLREELAELQDAMDQGSKVMMAVEAADLVGALKLFLERHLPGTTLADLETFSEITKRAFINGRRG